MKKQTKAERIFQVTYVQCKRQMEAFGKEYNPNGRPISFGSVCCDDNESVSIRTLNDIQKFIDNRKGLLALDRKYGVQTEEEISDKEYILEAVQVAADSNRKSLEDFAAKLNSCKEA